MSARRGNGGRGRRAAVNTIVGIRHRFRVRASLRFVSLREKEEHFDAAAT